MNLEIEKLKHTMKVLVFGTGNEYCKYKRWLKNVEIIALIDNDSRKQGMLIDNIPVISPEDIISYTVDRVYIMSSLYVLEMNEQLIRLGVPEEKIYYLFDLADLEMKYEAPIYEPLIQKNETKKIVLISDNLQLSGAQFALLNAAILLRKNGYLTIIASPESGKLKSYIQQAGIQLLVDERLRTGKMTNVEWMNSFDLIIVNTVLNYHLLLDRNTDIPVIWWLHETEYFYRFVIPQKMELIDPRNLHIYAVSKLAKQPLSKIRKDFLIRELLVYVKENRFQGRQLVKSGGKIILAVIGVVCELKGQDIILHALDELSEDENGQIEIWFVGREDESFISRYRNAVREHDNVRIYGELEKSDLKKLYKEIDVIICASRSENLCMAVLEGAEQNIVPIISTAAAISDYFTDRWNGIIFQSENTKELAEKILWCIQNSDKLVEMGRRAHDVYKTYFSEAVFEENLLHIVRKAWDACITK